jgi:hypothetical protein
MDEIRFVPSPGSTWTRRTSSMSSTARVATALLIERASLARRGYEPGAGSRQADAVAFRELASFDACCEIGASVARCLDRGHSLRFDVSSSRAIPDDTGVARTAGTAPSGVDRAVVLVPSEDTLVAGLRIPSGHVAHCSTFRLRRARSVRLPTAGARRPGTAGAVRNTRSARAAARGAGSVGATFPTRRPRHRGSTQDAAAQLAPAT